MTSQGSRVMVPSKQHNTTVLSTATNIAMTQKRGNFGVSEWLEVWDYSTGLSFRGFVGGTGSQRSLFVFFDEAVVGQDLKPGLMALIELADISTLDCSKLVVCIERSIDPVDLKPFIRDLGWVGFELTTMAPWSGGQDLTSKRWLMLAMET